MRILFVIDSLDPRNGGTVECIRQVGAAVANIGNSVEVACFDLPAAAWLSDFPLKTYALGPKYFKYGYCPRLATWLHANARHYDAIIVSGLWQYQSLCVWRALRGKTTPYFVYAHGMLDPWSKRAQPLKHLKKALYWRWAEYRVLTDAAGVLFTSEEERFLARECFSRYTVRELLAGNGIRPPAGNNDQQLAAFYAKFPGLAGKRILLFLGRLHEKKGCDLLLEAFAAVATRDPRLHVVLVGEGSARYTATLKEKIAQLGLTQRVTLAGFLLGDEKWGAFRACEVFVLPSHQENFGIAVVEALACAKPVLISDKVNIWREIIAHAAGLARSDTLPGTTQLLQAWTSLSDPEKLEMARSAKACFVEQFEIQPVAKRLVEVIETEIHARKRGKLAAAE